MSWVKPAPKSFKEQIEQAAKATAARRGQSYSSFWLDESYLGSWEPPTERQKQSPEYVMKLANIRRGIANFVRIVTGRDIPVHFSSGQQSYSVSDDGAGKVQDRIIISATDDPTQFDVNVGLALHEAAHLIWSKKTDAKESIPLFDLLTEFKKIPLGFFPPILMKHGERLDRTAAVVAEDVRFILNVIEDRRIDKLMYQTAIGYRPYYDAMYKALWQSEANEQLIVHPRTHLPLVKNYKFHICNMTNARANPDFLPGLRDIWELIDLPNIGRFVNDPKWMTWKQQKHWNVGIDGSGTYPIPQLPDMFQCVLEVVTLIYEHSKLPDEVLIDSPPDATGDEGPPTQSSKGKQNQPKSDSSDGDDEPEDSDELDNWDIPDVSDPEGTVNEKADEDASDEEGSTPADSDEDTNEDESSGPSAEEKTDDAEEDEEAVDQALDEILDRMSKSADGEIEKEDLDESVQKQMDALEGAGAELVESAKGLNYHTKPRVIVYHTLSEPLLSASGFIFTRKKGGIPLIDRDVIEAIREGIRIGNMLTHRLRIMADSSPLTFTRQRHGKLDKRLISGLGFGEESVFNQTIIEKHKPVRVNLFIDSSGSMQGAKWLNSITLAAALAKCAKSIPILEVSISFRASDSTGLVHVLVAWDSKKDSFATLQKLFPYLRAEGGTPEGLAFEVLKNWIIDSSKNIERRFFVNISDGDPQFEWRGVDGGYHSYTGENSWRHTAKQVQEIRDAGITVLSYFVHDVLTERPYYGSHRTWGEKCKEAFNVMYGRDAAFIDPKSVIDIARTLNNIFLKG